VLGAPFGPKSRGGVVTVLGGATGPVGVWACAAAAPIARVPAPSARTKWRRVSVVLDAWWLVLPWVTVASLADTHFGLMRGKKMQ